MLNFFTEDSQLVKEQALLVKSGRMGRDDIPNLFNLREVVLRILDNTKEEVSELERDEDWNEP